MNKTGRSNVGVFRVGHLGDTLVAMPSLWSVRNHFRDSKIFYITHSRGLGSLVQGPEVLGENTVCDGFIIYEVGGLRDWKKLLVAIDSIRKQKIRSLVYLATDRSKKQILRDRIFFFLAGVRRFYGVKGAMTTDVRRATSPDQMLKSEVDTMLDNIVADGIVPPDRPENLLHLGLTQTEKDDARDWLRNEGCADGQIVLAMGVGSKMPSKLWPLNRYEEVSVELEKLYSPFFVFLGSASESDACASVLSSLRHGANAAGKLTIRQSAAVLSLCKMYIGNDTGTMHLAASNKKPCLAIFASRENPGRWYPYGSGHIPIRQIVPCAGCRLEICDRDNLCTKLTESVVVLAAARKILGAVDAQG